MSNLKNPLLSLGARGTLGEAFTFTRRRSQNIVEKKPIPAYRRTLHQVYQRWLYEDYVAYWNDQTLAVKRQYAATGSRYHLTGFQYWMRYHLQNLPDLAGWWKLDDNQGPTFIDSSRNTNTGTIIGCSLARGYFDACLEFDGVNDNCTIPDSPSLNPTDAITLECWVNAPAYGDDGLIWKAPVFQNGYYCLRLHPATGRPVFYINNTGPTGIVEVANGRWHHIAATYDRFLPGVEQQKIFVDGVLRAVFPKLGAIVSSPDPLILGYYERPTRLFGGRLDDVRVYNRALTAADILRHASRRYP